MFLEVSHTYAIIFKLFTYIYSLKMAEKIFMVGIILLVCKTTFPATITVLNEKNETIVTLPSLSAAFGPSLLNDKLVGHVWLTVPLNACIPVKPPTSYNSSLPFIGLVIRQDCSFVEKVLNVQKAGFKGALIFDPKFDDLITMSGSSGSILIPSFFIGKSSEQILSNYLESKFSVEIEDNFPNSFGLFLIPLVIGMLLCLIFVIIFLLMRYTSGLVNQWRQRLSRSVLRLLPLRKFKKGDFYDTCAVCLEDFKVNEKLRILPCNHAYHQDCIDPWLTENRRTCPLCNKLILAHDTTENPLEVPDEQTPLIANQATTSASGRSAESAPSSSRVLHDNHPNPQVAPA